VTNPWRDWLEHAGVLLAEVRTALEHDALVTVAFFSQQVAEQSLKALWLIRSDRLVPHTHDIVDLAISLEVPGDVLADCQLLNPLYTTSRYPDAANGAPAKNLNANAAASYAAAAARVYEWCARALSDGASDAP
jgi:HEPN domain-containing protein